MIRGHTPVLVCCVLAVAGLMLFLSACSPPTSIPTPRREIPVNLDSIITGRDFFNAPGDSIFGSINGQQLEFATDVFRPQYYNDYIDGAYYISVQATRSGIDSREYEAIYFRLDGIRDTGTYIINSSYSLIKGGPDPSQPPLFGVRYDRKLPGGFSETYDFNGEQSMGIIRIVKIDREKKVMVGTFQFKVFNKVDGTWVIVDEGVFRLTLPEED